MKIKSTNHYYEIGSSHDDCQDFALSGMINPNIAYAILSDGCSSSNEICRELDFGTRLLCYSARKWLKFAYNDADSLEAPFTNNDLHAFLTKSIGDAEEQRKFFNLHSSALDATLLLCVSDNKRTNVVLYGDGGFVYKKHGHKTIYHTYIEFESGGPYYPSYSLFPSRMDSYTDAFGKYDVKMHANRIEPDGVIRSDFALERSFNNSFYNQTAFSIEGDLDFIALTSDGINSFQKPHPEYGHVKTIDATEIIPEAFGFRNLAGQFVERRAKNFKKHCVENSMIHYDDFSISAISFTP